MNGHILKITRFPHKDPVHLPSHIDHFRVWPTNGLGTPKLETRPL